MSTGRARHDPFASRRWYRATQRGEVEKSEIARRSIVLVRARRYQAEHIATACDPRRRTPRSTPYWFTASLNALPAVNLTVFDAAIWSASPVFGLRPARATRAPVLKDPNPMS